MAEVYSKVDGEQIQRAIARVGTVQKELTTQAYRILGEARTLLAQHTKTGNARVGYERGNIDRYVYLEDPDSFSWDAHDRAMFEPGDAMAIEMGHWNDRTRDWTPGLHILGRASGLR